MIREFEEDSDELIVYESSSKVQSEHRLSLTENDRNDGNDDNTPRRLSESSPMVHEKTSREVPQRKVASTMS